MKSIKFELSDCGVWYAEVGIPAKAFHSFAKTSRCALTTHIGQTMWFPMGSVAEVFCGNNCRYGIVIGIEIIGQKMDKIQVTLCNVDKEYFDGALQGAFLQGNDLN